MTQREKNTAIYPSYTENPVYQELVIMANNAGIKIEYREQDDDNVVGEARAPEYQEPVVDMMNNFDYGTDEHAAFLLAHEIAHTLVSSFYSEASHHFYQDTSHVRWFIEADADKIGAALYCLAEMTANFRAESVIREQVLNAK